MNSTTHWGRAPRVRSRGPWLRLRFDPDKMKYGPPGPAPISHLLEHRGPLRYVGSPSDGKWG